MGAMSEEEVMISNQARNFPGRNGHPKARHYLASAGPSQFRVAGKISGRRISHEMTQINEFASLTFRGFLVSYPVTNRQIRFPPSSEINTEPSGATVTPTGRPHF